jgi:hypothetical protein
VLVEEVLEHYLLAALLAVQVEVAVVEKEQRVLQVL